MSTLTPFGVEMRKLRLNRNLRLFDVASSLGVTSAFLSAVETGRKSIPDGFLVKLSRALNISTEEVANLRKAIDRTRKEVRVDDKAGHERELIAAFARRLDNVPASLIEELKKIVLKSSDVEVPFARRRRGIFVPPISTAVLTGYAEKIRAIFVDSDTIEFPIIDVIEWGISKIDSNYIFDVRDKEEMGHDEGQVPIGKNEIILRLDVYDGACAGEPRSRFTAAHELAHYLMHRNISLARVRDDGDKIYCDSEWQADSFAGRLLMSHRHISLFNNFDQMAAMCRVSKNAAQVMWSKYESEGIIR
jgi:Zn-dependent peptidase ImmA (M78 family)/plasmid maintenance system antidote protein VapI